jgi:hypothetical protein
MVQEVREQCNFDGTHGTHATRIFWVLVQETLTNLRLANEAH